MDIRKVFDQTVRDLRREVNKKVLKVPEIEQKVLDATSNEPWGPHGSLMAEIAQATRNYSEYQMIMSILWRRLSDTGKNWRHVYKALTVMEYLVAHGSEKAIDEFREQVFQIQTLSDFQYEEPNGRDQGINVRKKAQSLVALLNDKEKIRGTRQKAASNRDKYQGFSSSGGKASSYANVGRSFGDWGDSKYGGYGGTNEVLRSSPDADRHDGDENSYAGDYSSFRTKKTSPAYEEPVKNNSISEKKTVPVAADDDDDDFNPRAANAAPASKTVEVDFFGQDFLTPSSSSNIDPFAPTDSKDSVKVTDPFPADLFTSTPVAAVSAAPSALTADPFTTPAADEFTAFTSASATEFGAFTSAPSLHSGDVFNAFDSAKPAAAAAASAGNPTLVDPLSAFDKPSRVASNVSTQPKPFKSSSIWDDPLTSELINLNIAAPKSNALADFDWAMDAKPASKAMGGVGVGISVGSTNTLPAATSTPLFPPPARPPANATTASQDPFAFEWK